MAGGICVSCEWASGRAVLWAGGEILGPTTSSKSCFGLIESRERVRGPADHRVLRSWKNITELFLVCSLTQPGNLENQGGIVETCSGCFLNRNFPRVLKTLRATCLCLSQPMFGLCPLTPAVV